MRGVVGQIPSGEQDRDISALAGTRRGKQQQYLVVTFEECLNFLDDELLVSGRLEAPEPYPLR